jgi:hypothetical protein
MAAVMLSAIGLQKKQGVDISPLLLVFGIESPGGNFIGTPPADVVISAGDEVVIYGPSVRVAELDDRRAGEAGDRTRVLAAREWS